MSDREAIGHLTGAHADIQVVLDLAAQAGVRYSLVDPTPSAAERDGALGLAGGRPAAPPVPDAKTIWLYREHLTRAGALRLQVPCNVSVLLLPPCSPEPNPQENIWNYLRQNYVANRVLDTYEAIVDACCDAWNRRLKQTDRITSIATREWAPPVRLDAAVMSSV